MVMAAIIVMIIITVVLILGIVCDCRLGPLVGAMCLCWPGVGLVVALSGLCVSVCVCMCVCVCVCVWRGGWGGGVGVLLGCVQSPDLSARASSSEVYRSLILYLLYLWFRF